jgi:phage terminase large subunit-like protein
LSAGSRRRAAEPARTKRRLNRSRAENVISFIECLKVPSGEGQGRPFRLRQWQRKFIFDVYAPEHPNGRRMVRRAVLSIARKNGKTPLAAALVLVHLVGPESVTNGEIYAAANDRDQAGQTFKYARQMVESDAELSGMLRIVPSTKTINHPASGSFFRAVSAESTTKHGYNASFVVFDELAQARSRDLYDVLDTSMGARAEPLFLTISTQSNDPEHILSKIIDDGLSANDPTTVCHLYEAKEDCDLGDRTQWKAANPALGDFRDLDDLAALVAKAIRMPAEEPKVRNLFLNQRVSPVSSLISRAEWMACAARAEIPEGAEVYLGLDMSAVVDLTALVLGTAGEKTNVRAFIWKPEELLKEHSDRDFGSGNARYVQWHKEGHLLVSPGRSIDPAVVALKIIEIWKTYKVLGLAYDRWRIADLLREFDRLGFEAWEDKGHAADDGVNRTLRTHKQAPACASYRGGRATATWRPRSTRSSLDVTERHLEHPSNPVLTWAMANAVATMDPAGNRKLDKDKARFRIDPAVALTMVCGLKSRDRAARKPDYQIMIL